MTRSVFRMKHVHAVPPHSLRVFRAVMARVFLWLFGIYVFVVSFGALECVNFVLANPSDNNLFARNLFRAAFTGASGSDSYSWTEFRAKIWALLAACSYSGGTYLVTQIIEWQIKEKKDSD